MIQLVEQNNPSKKKTERNKSPIFLKVIMKKSSHLEKFHTQQIYLVILICTYIKYVFLIRVQTHISEDNGKIMEKSLKLKNSDANLVTEGMNLRGPNFYNRTIIQYRTKSGGLCFDTKYVLHEIKTTHKKVAIIHDHTFQILPKTCF